MDLRITNTCNNNCLYCLEQDLRNKENFIAFKKIKQKLENIREENSVISFYGGNSLLHPDIIDIISYCKHLKFVSISILTNSYHSNPQLLGNLIKSGLTGISIYFHSSDRRVHDTIVNDGISLKQLYENITTCSERALYLKIIIHVNKLNISALSRDILFLYKNYKIDTLEFVNYFPFDRPYQKYHTYLGYDITDYRKHINSLFETIKLLGIETRFFKFPQSFFSNYLEYYSYNYGIKQQISQEDKQRIDTEHEPECFIEDRCPHCFIQDNCPWYGERYSR